MTHGLLFPIGTPGKPWGDAEKAAWRTSRTLQRSYREEVLVKIEAFKDRYTVEQYGALSQDTERYPLFVVTTRKSGKEETCDADDNANDNDNGSHNKDKSANETASKQNKKPKLQPKLQPKSTVLITGGVHGYETSGVQGALLFLDKYAHKYTDTFDFVVAPCVSPWGYETVQRWNCHAVDPNRSFNPEGEIVPGRSFNPEAATEESASLIAYLKKHNLIENVLCHLDLHETTDTDDTEFRPAKAARDGQLDAPSDEIPDGFYLVSDATVTGETITAWYKAMIDSVRTVTHIAPSAADGTIIGEPVVQDGVIAIPSPALLGLCAGVTRAPFATTTEVYPDSPNATPEICNQAQVACITGALDYIILLKIL